MLTLCYRHTYTSTHKHRIKTTLPPAISGLGWHCADTNSLHCAESHRATLFLSLLWQSVHTPLWTLAIKVRQVRHKCKIMQMISTCPASSLFFKAVLWPKLYLSKHRCCIHTRCTSTWLSGFFVFFSLISSSFFVRQTACTCVSLCMCVHVQNFLAPGQFLSQFLSISSSPAEQGLFPPLIIRSLLWYQPWQLSILIFKCCLCSPSGEREHPVPSPHELTIVQMCTQV